MQETQVAVFSLGGYICGIDTEQIHTILRYQQPEKNEGMPDFIDGTISWRNFKIPIIDLNERFGLGSTQVTKKTKILIVKAGKGLAGFIVDDVNKVLKYLPESIEPAPAVLNREDSVPIKAVGKSEDRLVPILDFSGLLSGTEMEQVESATIH